MAELVDARDLKSLDGNIVPVQVRLRVPNFFKRQSSSQENISEIKAGSIAWRPPRGNQSGSGYHFSQVTTNLVGHIEEINTHSVACRFLKP